MKIVYKLYIGWYFDSPCVNNKLLMKYGTRISTFQHRFINWDHVNDVEKILVIKTLKLVGISLIDRKNFLMNVFPKIYRFDGKEIILENTRIFLHQIKELSKNVSNLIMYRCEIENAETGHLCLTSELLKSCRKLQKMATDFDDLYKVVNCVKVFFDNILQRATTISEEMYTKSIIPMKAIFQLKMVTRNFQQSIVETFLKKYSDTLNKNPAIKVKYSQSGKTLSVFFYVHILTNPN